MSVGAGSGEEATAVQSWGQRMSHAMRDLSHVFSFCDGAGQRAVQSVLLIVQRERASAMTSDPWPLMSEGTDWDVKGLWVGPCRHRTGEVTAGKGQRMPSLLWTVTPEELVVCYLKLIEYYVLAFTLIILYNALIVYIHVLICFKNT